MDEFFNDNKYGFKRDEDEEWFLVHDSAVTNTNPNSIVQVKINTRPICENMTNREFREIIRDILNRAIPLVDSRISALQMWRPDERSRVARWFGRSDESARRILLNGLPRVAIVLRSLTPGNFVRASPEQDKMLGCTPNPVSAEQEAAHVCGPDTATHTISISPKFCTMRHWSADSDSRVSTVIHEVTHFLDTMATKDSKYTIAYTLRDWARDNSNLALNNADSIAGYIVEGD
ncbi:M35 family metallo-endopeptidase [Paraburkholderia bannensis]|uniref:M35 family metallo-endopeptidase n=1 Tax=Paraburkholderia bannensis TaxID=765414 RepID=UPI002AB28201|nr:M35 family metallo-endopeptidase [Paraburkholderia bannensis]